MQPLKMTDSDKVYLSGPRIDPLKYPHDFYIYSPVEDNLKDVLLWTLENVSGAWAYHYIDDLSEIVMHEDPYDDLEGVTLENRLALVSGSVYYRHIKIYFSLEQDAVLFKLRWQ